MKKFITWKNRKYCEGVSLNIFPTKYFVYQPKKTVNEEKSVPFTLDPKYVRFIKFFFLHSCLPFLDIFVDIFFSSFHQIVVKQCTFNDHP